MLLAGISSGRKGPRILRGIYLAGDTEKPSARKLLIARMIERPGNTDRYLAPFAQFLPLLMVCTKYGHKSRVFW